MVRSFFICHLTVYCYTAHKKTLVSNRQNLDDIKHQRFKYLALEGLKYLCLLTCEIISLSNKEYFSSKTRLFLCQSVNISLSKCEYFSMKVKIFLCQSVNISQSENCSLSKCEYFSAKARLILCKTENIFLQKQDYFFVKVWIFICQSKNISLSKWFSLLTFTSLSLSKSLSS